MKIKLAFVFVISFLFLSFAPTIATDDEVLKNKLVGTWSGSEEDNERHGVTKYWVQIRNKNGTFVLMMTTIENCEVETNVRKGKWGIKNGFFCETMEGETKADIYTVAFLDNNQVKFKAKQITFETDNKVYEFLETRQE